MDETFERPGPHDRGYELEAEHARFLRSLAAEREREQEEREHLTDIADLPDTADLYEDTHG